MVNHSTNINKTNNRKQKRPEHIMLYVDSYNTLFYICGHDIST
jgi:hypothetical protein